MTAPRPANPHAGYGATRRTSVRYYLHCPYYLHAGTKEVPP
ncbi:MAG: hypothetical protein ACRD0U_17560 [Acidimicrobiales bacterium]